MEGNEFNVAGETLGMSTSIRKPTAEVSKIMSNEILKVCELNERCNCIDSDLKKWYKRVQKLSSAKNESGKIITEYKIRNKINVINSESLLQALNELYKYKSELKSSYIATEKELKIKKVKYKKVLSTYESSWQKALKEYNTDPIFTELHKIQQENLLLEKQIEEQEKLNSCTTAEFGELEENIKKTFRETTVAFSKFMLQYKHFLSSRTPEKDKTEKLLNSKGNFQLFQFKSSPFVQKVSPDGNEDQNYTCSIDLSIFDDVIIPSENLESQNLEEDGYSFTQNEGQQLTDSSKEEAMEYLNNYRQTQQNVTTEKDPKDNSTAVKPVDENESQYFRQQGTEIPKEPPKEDLSRQVNIIEKSKPARSVPGQAEIEEEPTKDQTEGEESISEGSYEKQISHNRETSDCHYQKTSSVSSDDLPPGGENPNEGDDANKQISKTKSDLEKNFGSFAGFFSMGDDQGTPKPSIFKLF